MAKLPTDLSNESWKKVKALTLTETGFGKVLDAYQAARHKTKDLQTRNIASFQAAAVALAAISKAVPGVLAKCNKTLHKDTITALGAYAGLVKAEGLELNKESTAYLGYIDTFNHKREVGLKELLAFKKAMEELGKKQLEEVKKVIATDHPKTTELAKKLVEKYKADLDHMQTEINSSIEKWRVPPVKQLQAHMDDRSDKLFKQLTDLPNEIIADRKNIAAALEKAAGQ